MSKKIMRQRINKMEKEKFFDLPNERRSYEIKTPDLPAAR